MEYTGAPFQTAVSGHSQKIDGFADVKVTFNHQTKYIRLFIIPSLSNNLYLGIIFG